VADVAGIDAMEEYLLGYHRLESGPIPEWHLAGVRFKRYGRNSIIRDGLLASTGDLQAAALLIANLRGFCGVVAFRWMSAPPAPREADLSGADVVPMPVRVQPSGGALYPNEAYIVIRGPIASTALHYDPLNDDLDIVRVNIPNQAVARALGCSVPDIPPATLVLTVRFEKNGFKYQEFSYRLSSLDTGVTIGSALEVLESDQSLRVRYIFDDKAVNRLLNLDWEYESAYATMNWSPRIDVPRLASALQSSSPVTRVPRDHQRRISLSRWPLLLRLHERSSLNRKEAATARLPVPALVLQTTIPIERQLDINLVAPHESQCTESCNPRVRESDFPTRLETMPMSLLACLLQRCCEGYATDVSRDAIAAEHLLVYLIVRRVEGFEPGAYCYEPSSRRLWQVAGPDCLADARNAARLPAERAGIDAASVMLVPVGDIRTGARQLGSRWYRVLNMHAGVVVQRAYSVVQHELLCRASLGFSVDRMDSLFRLPSGLTSLAQVLIGGGERRPHVLLRF